jgi:hypothetical protein
VAQATYRRTSRNHTVCPLLARGLETAASVPIIDGARFIGDRGHDDRSPMPKEPCASLFGRGPKVLPVDKLLPLGAILCTSGDLVEFVAVMGPSRFSL